MSIQVADPYKRKLLAAAVALLLYLPAFALLAYTYGRSAAPQFCSRFEYEILWEAGDPKFLKQTLRDIAWNSRLSQRDLYFEVKSRSQYSSYYMVSAFADDHRVARLVAQAVCDDLERLINGPARERIRKARESEGKRRVASGLPEFSGLHDHPQVPVRFWSRPSEPFLTASPNIRRVVIVGTSIGMVFAFIGLALVVIVFRTRSTLPISVPEEAQSKT